MTDVYDELDRRTGAISAYAIHDGATYVGRVVFINSAACTCYFQVWGAALQKGIARGGNYDRHTAAAEVAVGKMERIEGRPAAEAKRQRIRHQILNPNLDGQHWDRRLEDNGFQVERII